GHARIRRAVEQDAAGVAQQPKRPVGDHKRADEAGKWVHPKPAERTGHQKPSNDQNGYGGISHDVNNGSPHIVVAVMPAMPSIVIAFFQFDIERAGAQVDAGRFLAMIMIMAMTMAVAVLPAGPQPRPSLNDHQ